MLGSRRSAWPGTELKSIAIPASSTTPSSARASVSCWRSRQGRSRWRRPTPANDQRQPGRAVFEICRPVCWLLTDRDDRRAACTGPGRARLRAGDRLCAGGARVKRLDAQAVIGLADQPLVERGAFERRLDQPAPFVARRWREIRRRGGRSSSHDRAKWPQLGALGHASRSEAGDGIVRRHPLEPGFSGRVRTRRPAMTRSSARFRPAAPARRRARTGAGAAGSGPARSSVRSS